MKPTGFLAVLLATTAVFAQEGQPTAAAPAQTPQIARTNLKERVNAPSPSKVYCAGFISKDPISRDNHVIGGEDSPNQARFAGQSTVFLTGNIYQAGGKYQILRHLKDPNEREAYKGQRRQVAKLGETYGELGIVTVQDVRQNVAIASIDLSCDAFNPGDIAVPFQERQIPEYRSSLKLDRWTPPSGKPTGRIVLASEYAWLVGDRRIGYIDLGSEAGLKTGDYLRAVRSYDQKSMEPIDRISLNARTGEPTQKTTVDMFKETGRFPRKTLGSMMVLNVQPRTATVIIDKALEPIYVGDGVEVMDEAALAAATPAAPEPPPQPAAQPPTISCTANPSTLRAGDRATVSCQGVSPDERPLEYTFTTSAGHLTNRGNFATLDTAGVASGPLSITANVADDRNLTASTNLTVAVEAPPPVPTPMHIADVEFPLNSSRVDNAGKALLDDFALRLQQNPDMTAVVMGATDPAENTALGMQRGSNSKTYLMNDKGIDSARVTVRPSTRMGRRAELWLVPAGATAP